jgi:site-specific DNA-methyltransferase (adenine-specific)
VTPYYQRNATSIYLGDCREVMPQLGKFDLIVADPPYGDTSLDWDKKVRGWVDVAEQAASSMWVFGSFRFFMGMSRVGDFSRWNISQELVWEKQNGSGFHADRFKRVHEFVVHLYRGMWTDIYKEPVKTMDATARAVRRKKRPPHTGHIEAGAYESHDGGPRLMRSVIYEPNCHGYAIHPTQKPVGIVKPLIQYSLRPGGRVLDPFCGSGTTLEVSREMGAPSVGIEIDEAIAEKAARRLDHLEVAA